MAFILTPLIAAFALACWLPLYEGLPSLPNRIFLTTKAYAVFGAYPPALAFGIPALLILRTRVRATLLNCGVVGLIIAIAPWLILGTFSHVDYAYSNGHVTVQDGATTIWGGSNFSGSLA